MKILLVTGSPYFPLGRSGNSVVLRYMLRDLAARGHEVTLICCAHAASARGRIHDEILARLQQGGTTVSRHARHDAFGVDGVEIHAVRLLEDVPSHLEEVVRRDGADRVVVSGPDIQQRMIRTALATSAVVVYLCQGVGDLPGGPLSLLPNDENVSLLRRASGIVAVGEYVAAYVRQWLGVEATAIHAPAYGPGPFPLLGSFGSKYVSFVNPSKLKGIEIFLDLVQRFPEIDFAAVPSWGTTPAEIELLSSIPNVRLLDFVEDIDVLLRDTKILLVPSLFPEGFPLVTVEAMLRGVPVIASDAGGTREAMLGMNVVIEVAPISGFLNDRDPVGLPVPIVPTQDLAPWRDSLERLFHDEDAYTRHSRLARAAAIEFASTLGVEPFERFLQNAPRVSS